MSMISTIAAKLLNDEAGFVVSAELVLVSSIAIIGCIVGLSEVATNITHELNDCGAAFGSMNQSYSLSMSSGKKVCMSGSFFKDHGDECDCEWDISCDSRPQAER